MTEAVFFDILRQGLWTAVVMSAPLLGVALVAGVVVGLFQALTSVQEQTMATREIAQAVSNAASEAEQIADSVAGVAGISAASHGGAAGRVPMDATAYAHRDAKYQISISVDWDKSEDGPGWLKYARDYWSVMEPLSDGGFYVNTTDDDRENTIRKNYRGNYERLVDIKTAWDPDNAFRLNANIPPRRKA